MSFRTLEELIVKNKIPSAPRKLAVAAAGDEHTLDAVIKAQKEGIIEPLLIGERDTILRILESLGAATAEDTIYNVPDVNDAAAMAVEFVREGRADFLMKGKLNTSEMLRPIVKKETGLLDGAMVSLLSIAQIPTYHKLLFMSDAGIVVNPTLEEKKGIIENAVRVLRTFGYDMPKVAVMAAVENVTPKMPETIHAAQLTQMNRNGEIKYCIIEGPLSMDIAFNSEAASIKGYQGQVAGDPDILIWPSVVAGNLTGKALTRFGGSQTITIAVGARVPLVITTRGAPTNIKYLTIAAAAAALGKI